ncbi:MAG: leucine-rich repeat domain-containing protein [Muribaculaceae bacterium]|nr:leucine-rich repeat domain-containing protein [Muribaculaceae bacterium]
MKKILTLFAVMLYMTTIYAMELTLSPGMLPEKIGLLERTNDHKLILKGTVTSADLISLHLLPSTVEAIDMSKLKIKGGVMPRGDLFGQSVFKDGEIPAYMLFSTNVKSVQLPAETVIIGRGAFASTPLTSIKVSGCTDIGEGAFQNCGKLKEADFSASGFIEIPENVFSGCSLLSDLKLPFTIAKIGDKAFEKSGVTLINLPRVRTIGDYAFAFCEDLGEITFAANCRMGEGVFYGTGNIEKMFGSIENFPPLFASSSALSGNFIIKSEEVEEGAFAGSKIRALGLGKDVKRIGPYAFSFMPELKEVVVSGCDFIPKADTTSFEGNDVGSIALHVKKGETERWRSAPVWCDFYITEAESGVDEITGAESMIGVSRRGDKILITSASGVSRVDLFTLDGVNLLSQSPASDSVEIEYPDGYEVILVRVESVGLVKVAKLTK